MCKETSTKSTELVATATSQNCCKIQLKRLIYEQFVRKLLESLVFFARTTLKLTAKCEHVSYGMHSKR